MFKRNYVFMCLLLCGSAWGQITKEELFEMTNKQVEEHMLISMVQRNCVDFEMDGQTVVELTQRISSSTLRAVVDCIRVKEEAKIKAQQEALLVEKEAEIRASMTEEIQPVVTNPVKMQAQPTEEESEPGEHEDQFKVPDYISVEFDSNKDSYSVSEVEFKLISEDPDHEEAYTVNYRLTGTTELDEPIRCYKKRGDDVLLPGKYIAYLHVVSHRKKGLFAKNKVRSDLHKFHVEYQGPGPIELAYTSQEEKVFSSKSTRSIKVHGPLRFFGEEQVSVDSRKSLDDLLNMTGTK